MGLKKNQRIKLDFHRVNFNDVCQRNMIFAIVASIGFLIAAYRQAYRICCLTLIFHKFDLLFKTKHHTSLNIDLL